MGSFGGSKSTSTSGPAASALPYVDRALGSVEGIVGANQGNLDAIGGAAIGAYNAVAPSAFGPNDFLTRSQGTAQDIATNGGRAYDGIGTPGAQPSAGLYSDIIGGAQLDGNPFLQHIIDSTNSGVTTAANRQFAARGMGAGISTPYANLLTKNLAANEGGLRYANYNDAATRQLTAAGQSDAAYNQSQALGLEARKAADATRLAALGMTPEMIAAQYAGVDPALALLTASATLPYTGANVLGGNIANLTGATNSSTSTTKGPGLGFSILAGAAQGAGSAAGAAAMK